MKDRNLMSLARLRQHPARYEQVQREWKGILSEVQFQEILPLEYPDYTSRPLIAGIRQWIGLFDRNNSAAP